MDPWGRRFLRDGRAFERMDLLNGLGAHGSGAVADDSAGGFCVDLFDHYANPPLDLFGGEVSPARERIEVELVLGDVLFRDELFTLSGGLVGGGSVVPDSLQRSAFGQSIDTLEARPVSALQDEILFGSVAQDVSQPSDESFLLVADGYGAVSPSPELLAPSGDSVGFSCEVSIDVLHEVRELIDIFDADQEV